MGIPSYFSYIVKNHSKIIKCYEELSHKVDNLYMDCNSIIYDVVHNLEYDELDILNDIYHDKIILLVINKIKDYISEIKPKNNIYIAFDGVAPLAKLDQQRSRRYKSWFEKQKEIEISMKNNSNVKIRPKWDTTAITPGTTFMTKLNNRISSEFKEFKFGVKRVIISGSNDVGEGEHKLFQYIRENKIEHETCNTVIYGLDADLIMLSLNHLSFAKRIYLYRETPHFIKTINSDLEPNKLYLIDIPELAVNIISDMTENKEPGPEPDMRRLFDYIFLCFFLGNDFMPHFPSCNIRTGGIFKLLNGYKSIIGNTKNTKNNIYITDGTKIVWNNLRKLVNFMAMNERSNLKKEHKKREKFQLNNYSLYITPKSLNNEMNLFQLTPCHNRDTETKINPFKEKWEDRYYEILFKIEKENNTKEFKKELCLNFMEGLEWTLKYYTTGCADWRWSYKYNYPPLFTDLIKYMPVFDRSFITPNTNVAVKEITQLTYVIPKYCLHLLPKKISERIKVEKPEWLLSDDNINNLDIFQWDYCKYFWESHVLLPKINIDELEKIIK